jgi:ATP-binding cassette subfamily B protein
MLPGAFRLVVDCGFGGAADSAFCAMFPSEGSLSIFFIIGILGALFLGVTSALRFYFISLLGERVVADLRATVYDHLLSLSATFYANTRTGEVLSRLTTDTTLIQTVVGSSISVALRTVATTSGALVLMIITSWQLALLMMIVGPLIILPMLYFGRRVRRLSRSSQDALAEASARASESLRAVDTVQAFTREPEERSRFRGAVEDTFKVSMRRIRVRSMLTASLFSFVLAGLIAVLWYGAVQVQNGSITPGYNDPIRHVCLYRCFRRGSADRNLCGGHASRWRNRATDGDLGRGTGYQSPSPTTRPANQPAGFHPTSRHPLRLSKPPLMRRPSRGYH